MQRAFRFNNLKAFLIFSRGWFSYIRLSKSKLYLFFLILFCSFIAINQKTVMNKLLLFITMSISTCTVHLFAQAPKTDAIILKGTISDKADQPLAYVSVGILNKPVGTVSDSLGNFSFEISNGNLSDTLQVSIVGYNSFQILVKNFISGPEKKIRLTERATQLEEVVVTSGKERKNTEIIGRQGSGKLTQVSIHHKTSVEETIGSEMGMRYRIEKNNAILKDLNFYISANNFNSIKFRINIYSVKNDLPDTLIYNKQIFTTLDKYKTGWTKIDLEDYNIKIKDDIIVTAQWIESSLNKTERPVTMVPVAMSLFSKNCYVRVASQDKWKKVGMKLSNFITIAY